MKFSLFTLPILFLLPILIYASPGSEDEYRVQLDFAKSEYNSGKIKSAVKIYRKIYSKSKNYKGDAIERLLSIFRDTKDYDSAIELVTEYLSENPFSLKSRLHLVEILIEKNEYQKALDEIRKAETISSKDQTVLEAKYKIHKKMSQDELAILTLNELIKISPNNYFALHARSQSFYNLGKYEDSFEDLQKSYSIRPFDELILADFIKTALKTKNYWIVQKLGKKCHLQFPTNFSCITSVGKMHYEKKSYDVAAKLFQKAKKLDQFNVENRVLLAESLGFSGKQAESDDEYSKIISMWPTSEIVMKSWFAQLIKNKNYQTLGQVLKDFCAKNPASIWASFEYSKLLLSLDEKKQASEVSVRLSNNNTSEVSKLYSSYILFLAEKYQESIEVLESISDSNLNNLFYMGVAAYKKGDEKAAEKYWIQYINSKQDSYYARLNLAALYEKTKKLDKAKAILAEINFPEYLKSIVENKLSLYSGSESRSLANEPSFYLTWELPEL